MAKGSKGSGGKSSGKGRVVTTDLRGGGGAPAAGGTMNQAKSGSSKQPQQPAQQGKKS